MNKQKSFKSEPAEHLQSRTKMNNHIAHKLTKFDGCNRSALRNEFYNVCAVIHISARNLKKARIDCTLRLFFNSQPTNNSKNVPSAVYANYSAAVFHMAVTNYARY